jgi:adenylate kinase
MHDDRNLPMKEHKPIRSAALLLGPPGSGKTTLANAVVAHEGIETVEAGPLLKKRLRDDPAMARQLKPHLENGEMVPTDLVEKAIADRLSEIFGGHVLFDGFPRTEEQIKQQLTNP